MTRTVKNLILIDSHALIHRAFHALPGLATKKGELVNAVYGFTSVLLKVLREMRPDYIAAAFDLPKATFRHKEYAGYKAKRPKTPDELSGQIPLVKEVLRTFKIPIYEKVGFEADDIIGTISSVATRDSRLASITILTGDLDTLQLVNDKVRVFTLKRGINDTVIYNLEAVKKRYGLSPIALTEFKGLKGDPSDNIPGVKGVGEKTAIKLIQEFGSIEELYGYLENKKKKIENRKLKIGNSLRAKLLASKDQALFSKYLATIRKDVPLKFNLQDCRLGSYNKEEVIRLFGRLEFNTLIKRLDNLDGPDDMSVRASSGATNVRASSDATSVSNDKGSQQTLALIEDYYEKKLFSKRVYLLEKGLLPVIRKMELAGIKIDKEKLKKVARKINKRIKKYESKTYKLAGASFNLNSPQQLSEILFKKLKIPSENIRKTSRGLISTSASELAKLGEKHSVIKVIEKYRELNKLKNTYVDVLPKLVNIETGRIHTTFHQLGTVTGRISSSEPNLQNIPVKTKIGREIRSAFVAEEGYKLVSLDYSQIELRIVASIAKDEKMLRAFREGKDIHRVTASQIFNIPISEVSPAMRRRAKAVNFGVIYGMSIFGLARTTGVSEERAKAFIEEYMRDFSGVARYIEEVKSKVKEKGYIETLLGRRRYLPEINSSNYFIRQQSERMAVNSPIQGLAADIIKLAMVGLTKLLSPQVKLLLQVHDELVFEIKDDMISKVIPQIKKIMENAYSLEATLEVEANIGDNWGKMKNYARTTRS